MHEKTVDLVYCVIIETLLESNKITQCIITHSLVLIRTKFLFGRVLNMDSVGVTVMVDLSVIYREDVSC